MYGALKIFGGRRSIGVRFLVGDVTELESTREAVRTRMRVRRGLKPSHEDNFSVSSSEQIVSLWEAISQAIFTALILLVSISLVVGGVVIMNIMLVSVTERIREVGTRKALGARRIDILWQFLVEAATLTMIGGAIGMILGGSLTLVARATTPLPAVVPLWSIIAALGVSAFTGVGFGLFPAVRAARMDPVEALRTE